MDDAQYQSVKAINWSTLKYIAVSPLLYKWRLEHPEPRKQAFVFGGAVHCLLLEPQHFAARYAECDVVRNAKHETYKKWLAEHVGAEALTPDEYRRVHLVADAVMDHRVAKRLLCGGRREDVVTWDDEATGLACKGRLDYLRPDFLIDLKSTRDPSPLRFERAASDYGYAAQVALYHDGATAARHIDGTELPYIIAPQTTAPYDVAVFQLKPETLEYGRAFYRGLLHRLLDCMAADYWPGVAPELQELGISPWAKEPFAAGFEEDF